MSAGKTSAMTMCGPGSVASVAAATARRKCATWDSVIDTAVIITIIGTDGPIDDEPLFDLRGRMGGTRSRPPVAGPRPEGTDLSPRASTDVRDRPLARGPVVSVRVGAAARRAGRVRGHRHGRALRRRQGRRPRRGPRDRPVVRVRQRLPDRGRPAQHAGRARRVRRRGGAQVSHLTAMVVFALFVSIVFSVLMRDEPAEQLRLGLRMFGGLVGGGILVGWLLYPLPL